MALQPFLNIINQFYVKDSSKKVKASMKQKGESSEYLTTNPPYVHAPDKSSGHRVQDVEISYNCIGILPATLLYDLQNGKTA